MVNFAVSGFGGEVPHTDSRLLANNMAEEAWNCDLASGPLGSLRSPERIQDFTLYPAAVRKAYRFPALSFSDIDVWLALPSEFSSVVRSPLANDPLRRLYWTNPPGVGADGAWWNTYARIGAGNTGDNAPYKLGTIAPTVAPFAQVTGGTTTVAQIARAYVYTWVDQYGQESPPSPPSVVVSGAPDGAWSLTGLPLVAPDPPAGVNFPTVVGMNIYRTTTGATSGATFFQIARLGFIGTPPRDPWPDTVADTDAAANLTLLSTAWNNPPDQLDGLTLMPGGMLVGFTGNTVHFCEPDRPHAWPAGYDLSVHYDIMGFGVWQNSLVVVTKGFPSTGSGANPASFTFQQIQVPEPCIARGSIITDLTGVYYASPNGLVQLNYYGMTNQTLTKVNRDQWLGEYHAAQIIACRHRAQYLAINGSGSGFIIDYSEQRLGIVHLNPFSEVVSVWNDDYSGEVYMLASNIVYRWDSANTAPLNFLWRSKEFYLPAPTNLGICQIASTEAINDPAPLANPANHPLDNGDPRLVLPDGVNAQFRLFTGNAGGADPVWVHNITDRLDVFRLPSGFKSFVWQFELCGRVPIHTVELASTMKELKGV